MVGVAELDVAKKADGSRERRTKAVKIDAPLVSKAEAIARDRGVPLSEYLSGMIRHQVERDWAKILRRLAEEEGGE